MANLVSPPTSGNPQWDRWALELWNILGAGSFSFSPGGSNFQFQYKSGTTFAGDSGFSTDGAGNIIINGSLMVDNLTFNGSTIEASGGTITLGSAATAATTFQVLATASTAGKIGIQSDTGTSANVVFITSPTSLATDITFTLPGTYGTSGYVLADTDGAGTLGYLNPATLGKTEEEIQDIVGAMTTGNTATGITVTYQDADGTIDFEVDDDFIKNTGDVCTGVYDFGGATSFEIPNGSSPTVDAAGEIAIDTTITDYTGLIKYHDGTEELTVVAMPTGNLTTTDNDVIVYDAAANEFKMAAQSSGGSGTLVQTVTASTATASSTTTVIPVDASIPQSSEGAEILTATITPTNTNNLLIIEFQCGWASCSAAAFFAACLFQDSTANALRTTSHYQTTVSGNVGLNLRHTMTAGTTSATTFKIRCGTNTGTTYFHQSNSTTDMYSTTLGSTLVIHEISV